MLNAKKEKENALREETEERFLVDTVVHCICEECTMEEYSF